ncbi:hypothetical protein QOT17_008598 [Balamuthia mandrillaris]
MCSICLSGPKFLTKLQQCLTEVGHPSSLLLEGEEKRKGQTYPTACLLGKCKHQTSTSDKLQTLQEEYQYFLTHLEHVEQQKKSFKEQKNKLQGIDQEAILVMDFKENIKLGISRDEEGCNFYSQPQRTIFGATLLYQEAEGQPLRRYLALKIGRDLVIISKTFSFGWTMVLDTFKQARPFFILVPNLLKMLVLHCKSM